MPRILFVDDEQLVLDGLQNALFRHRSSWEMSFVSDPERALEMVLRGGVDVIVSDMRMPVMDGARLLACVQEQQPQVVRVVLSAHAEFEATLRAVPVAHHFLMKPCDAEDLWAVVLRAWHLQATLRGEQLASVVRQAKDLPPAPKAYAEMTRVLADPGSGIDDCAAIVERDVSLAARVIRLANSAALGLATKVSSIRQAAVFLGTNMLRNVVLSVETFGEFQGQMAPALLETEQRHALLTGALARTLAQDRYTGENACLAGILHDLGHLVLACRLPAARARSRAVARHQQNHLHEAEQAAMGTTHARIGAWMLSSWGLPYPVVEAVAFHHDPATIPSRRLDAVGLVHIAAALASEVIGGERDPMDLSFIQRLGLIEELESWRRAAEATGQALASAL